MTPGTPGTPGKGESLAVRLYRRLLILLPRAFRERYGREMALLFRDEWRESAGWRRVRLSLRSFAGLVATAARVWMVPPGRGARNHSRTGGDGMDGTDGIRRGSRGGGDGWRSLGREVVPTARTLVRRPAFSVPLVAVLGLGIGASTTVWSAVADVVLRPLPYPAPEELVSFWTTFERNGDDRFLVSLAEFLDYREETDVLESVAAWTTTDLTLTGQGLPPRPVDAVLAFPEITRTLGLRAALGRPLGQGDAEGETPVVVLTHGGWQRLFGGDPAVVGSTIVLDRTSVEVVGVLAPDAEVPWGEPDLLASLAVERSSITDRSGHGFRMVGRLADGAGLAALRDEVDAVQRRWAERFAGEHSPGLGGHHVQVRPLDADLRGDARRTAWLLLLAVGSVLLLSWVNAAGLLLARGEERAGEMEVRRALGATRTHLARKALVESGLLAGAGALLGLGLSLWGGGALLALRDGAGAGEVRLDGDVILAVTALAVVAAVVFGTIPSLGSPGSLGTAWKGRGGVARQGRGAGPGRRGVSALRTLVVAQVTLSLILLTGAGLLVRSLLAVGRVDPGFQTEARWVFQADVPADAYPTPSDVTAFHDVLLDRVREIPEVGDAALVRVLPVADPTRAEGIVPAGGEHEGHEPWTVDVQAVGPRYLAVAGVPVVEGRGFTRADRADGAPVALVSASAAGSYWPGESPVGRTVRLLFGERGDPPHTVVGVVADVRHEGLDAPVRPTLYVPLAQLPPRTAGWARGARVMLAARPGASPSSLEAAARQALASVDASVPLTGFASFASLVRADQAERRFLTATLGVFGLLALVIAGVGIHGVVAFSVRRRRTELGVRLALGSGPSGLLRHVLGEALAMVAAGVVLGVVCVALLAPLLEARLYGVPAVDPVSLLGGGAALVLAALAAAGAPALRAARTDPVASLSPEG